MTLQTKRVIRWALLVAILAIALLQTRLYLADVSRDHRGREWAAAAKNEIRDGATKNSVLATLGYPDTMEFRLSGGEEHANWLEQEIRRLEERIAERKTRKEPTLGNVLWNESEPDRSPPPASEMHIHTFWTWVRTWRKPSITQRLLPWPLSWNEAVPERRVVKIGFQDGKVNFCTVDGDAYGTGTLAFEEAQPQSIASYEAALAKLDDQIKTAVSNWSKKHRQLYSTWFDLKDKDALESTYQTADQYHQLESKYDAMVSEETKKLSRAVFEANRARRQAMMPPSRLPPPATDR